MEIHEYKCSTCGGSNVEMKGWIKPNYMNQTSEFQPISQDPEDTWCNDCEDHTGLNYEPIKIKTWNLTKNK